MKVEIPNQLLVKVSGMVSRGIKEAEINVDGILVFTLTDGTKLELGSVKGDQGPRGESGVYVGTGEMPVDCNVQIDPSGEAFEFIQPPKTASIGQALLVKSIDETGKPTEWETGEVKGGSGGTSDHSKLSNRDAADQHPMKAITGLEAALEGKQPAGSYLTEESDPTVPAWAKTEKKPSYTAQEVGADPSGTAAGLVSSHNTAEAAHNDIRLLISGLTDRLNALADSDDTTLDQLSEVVAYIKANRELIASITTDKVSVTDIVNDLVTNVTNKPLSAAQGVALKALIDAITIPDKLPNPNALTFTGAVTGSYDGSAPLSVEIPSGGGAGGGSSQWKIIRDLTITENADRVDINTDDAGEAFSLHEIQVFAHTMSYGDAAESFTFLMNGYWGAGDPYFNSGFKSPKSSDNYYAVNHFIAIMQDGIADVFQPWKQYIVNSSTGGDIFSIGDKYQAIESVSFVGKFIAGCRFVLAGRVSS